MAGAVRYVGLFLAGLLIGSLATMPDTFADGASEHLGAGKPERWEQYLEHRGFVTLHDNVRKLPLWCAYRLTPDYLKNKTGRANDFKADPALPDQGRAHPADYHGSGLDLGHMVPSRDMRRTELIQESCFLLSNIAPQNSDLNRNAWKDLEIKTRDWARTADEMFIHVGPVLGHRQGQGGCAGWLFQGHRLQKKRPVARHRFCLPEQRQGR